jgi:hypothetical protein
MKTLEEEANEYAKNDNTKSYDFCNQTLVDAFESGANSKWVQAEKIKAQIEVLKPIVAEGYKLKAHHNNSEWKKQLELSEQKLIELRQQLKQLEDDNT